MNPHRIESGYDHVCALDDYGLQCWGRNAFGQADVPSLIDVSQVGAGAHHTCAIEAEGVICWGYNFFEQTEVPSGDLVFIQADVPGAETTVEPSVTASTALLAQVNHSVEKSESTYLTMTDKVETDSITPDFATFLKRLIGDLRLGF